MISHVFRRGRLMFTLSKTVEIAIMCSTALFAQNSMTDSTKIKVTERPATIEEKVVVSPNDSTSTSSPASKSKFRTNKTLQSYNFYLPIES